jgi:uncharacterized protein (TIGR00369 family)
MALVLPGQTARDTLPGVADHVSAANDSASPEPTPPWTEPARGGYPDPALFALPGLERLQSIVDGDSPQPPLSRLTGLRMIEVGVGSAVFEMPLSPWLLSPQGAISIGPLTIPADAALGCAIQTQVGPATAFTTSELSLRLLAPARAGETAVARARIVDAGRSLALSEATVTDSHGRLLAHGSSLCVVMTGLGPPPEDAGGDVARVASGATAAAAGDGAPHAPDPWARPTAGAVIPQEVWDERSGLEVLRAQLAGELPAPPICHLTGLRLTEVGDGAVSFTMPATEWLNAPPFGRAQGGTVALLGEAAVSAAIQTVVPPGTALAPVDLKVNYLRPWRTNGREAVAHGKLLHAGRRIAVASSEVIDADGRPIALATGSAMLLPDRPAALGDLSLMAADTGDAEFSYGGWGVKG